MIPINPYYFAEAKEIYRRKNVAQVQIKTYHNRENVLNDQLDISVQTV
jgi:hypothetical protein